METHCSWRGKENRKNKNPKQASASGGGQAGTHDSPSIHLGEGRGVCIGTILHTPVRPRTLGLPRIKERLISVRESPSFFTPQNTRLTKAQWL